MQYNYLYYKPGCKVNIILSRTLLVISYNILNIDEAIIELKSIVFMTRITHHVNSNLIHANETMSVG